jgi:hypothetical protein
MMRRSSFINEDIYNPLTFAMNKRRNVPEIVIEIPQIALQIPNPDRSPLYDVKNPAGASVRDSAGEVMFSRTIIQGSLDLRFHLVEPDGIEPTTSCLQSTRSPS